MRASCPRPKGTHRYMTQGRAPDARGKSSTCLVADEHPVFERRVPLRGDLDLPLRGSRRDLLVRMRLLEHLPVAGHGLAHDDGDGFLLRVLQHDLVGALEAVAPGIRDVAALEVGLL